MPLARVKHPQKLGDKLGDPDGCDLSLVVLFEGWLEDLERLHASAGTHLGGRSWEMVVVDNPVGADASERIAELDRVVHIPLQAAMGYGGARNLALRQASGRLVAIVDTSVEITGDVLPVLERDFADQTVGIVGRWGVSTRDGFEFEEADGPDVDGVEGYFMAARRSVVAEAGLFDAKFKWYRNADLDWSFTVRAAGYRTIVDPDLQLVRHVHRLWETTPEDERDAASRKNFWRFRDHWGERTDLFTALDG